MRVLVLGSGGREHALAWKIQQSPTCEKVYLHPGNAGTQRLGLENLGEIGPADGNTIAKKASTLGVKLIVIGPEALLAVGLADLFREKGFLVFGPGKKAAQLESSKVFAKEFMERARIPTSSFLTAEDDRELMALGEERHSFPVVLKLDGLAAGKGVVIAQNNRDILDFTDRVWRHREFGDGPHRVVVEEFIEGVEVSYIGLCDGHRFLPLESATDYKRLHDEQMGPNTGGMGAVSPSPFFNDLLKQKIEDRIINPVLQQLQKEGLEFQGALFIGLMIDPHGNPQVLEFNTRLGDPETQVILLRMKSDLLPYLVAAAERNLEKMPPMEWTSDTSVYVVAAAEGYPEKPQAGDVISGWETMNEAQLFFSGVADLNGQLVTQGGRVLGVGSLGAEQSQARTTAYRNLSRILWRGMHFRKDIGG